MQEHTNNSYYVYGDLHHHIDKAKGFLDRYKPNKVIWLGDFMDNYGDGPEDAKKTGEFMTYIIENRPQDIFILSNHDCSYRFPLNPKYHGHGFTHLKCLALHSTFPRRYWNRFKIFHTEVYNGKTVLFSHAGFQSRFMPNGVFNEEFMKRCEQIALANGGAPDDNAWLDSEFGPMWARYMPVLDGLNQCFGHTNVDKPVINKSGKYWTLNMDCAHTYVAYFGPEGIFSLNIKNGDMKKLDIE